MFIVADLVSLTVLANLNWKKSRYNMVTSSYPIKLLIINMPLVSFHKNILLQRFVIEYHYLTFQPYPKSKIDARNEF